MVRIKQDEYLWWVLFSAVFSGVPCFYTDEYVSEDPEAL